MTAIRDPLAGLRDDLALQREFVAPRAPVYGRTLDLLIPAIENELGDRLREAWRDRIFGPFFERPMLLLTALRDDVLREGEAHPLWRGLGSADADVEAVTLPAFEATVTPDREHLWRSLETRYVQTNDPSRAVAWMWPAALAATVEPKRPLELFDFGASAGLNLVADGLPWVWRRADGEPLKPDTLPPIVARSGFDLRPLDLREPDDARWLEALIWPGQHDRLERFAAGLAAFRALADSGRPLVEKASVDDAAAGLIPYRHDGPRAIAYQSIMHDYLPADVRERYDEALRGWLRASDPGAALWIEFEIAEGGEDSESVVAITASLSTGNDLESLVLARCGPHPRVVRVDDASVETFERILSEVD